jgi:hypothetical protein
MKIRDEAAGGLGNLPCRRAGENAALGERQLGEPCSGSPVREYLLGYLTSYVAAFFFRLSNQTGAERLCG